MSKEQLIKKAGLYTIFLVASTLFVYFTLMAALYPYAEKLNQLPAGSDVSGLIAEGIMLPMVFAILSLVILGLVQFLLLKPGSVTEKRIFSWVLIVFFGLALAMTILVLVGAFRDMATGAILGSVPALALSLSEIILGIIHLLEANQTLAKDNEPVAK